MFYSELYIWLSRFSSKKVDSKHNMNFDLAGEKNLAVNNYIRQVFITRFSTQLGFNVLNILK